MLKGELDLTLDSNLDEMRSLFPRLIEKPHPSTFMSSDRVFPIPKAFNLELLKSI